MLDDIVTNLRSGVIIICFKFIFLLLCSALAREGKK